MATIYITTPIYYTNDVPHIGHAYTTLAADVLTRFHRFIGNRVFFLTGTDEHGQKIARKAAEENMSPKEYVDKIVISFQDLWKKLDISYDYFIRTTDPIHHATCQEFFRRVKAQGDIYKGTYRGLYCTGCESFKNESDLVDGKCPDHNKAPEWLEEEDYFFRWSRYQTQLEDFFGLHPQFVLPKTRYNETRGFLKKGLQDIPITRTLIDWGIPVPDDPQHVLYVWFDALINYLTGIGWNQPELADRFEQFWQQGTVIHLMAKDILSKHALLWPAMLMSAGIKLPSTCFSHGYFTKDGLKISKSIGNTIDPFDLHARFGADAFRFFFLREFSFGDDGDYSEKRFLERHNSDLANDLGNLVSRVTAMVHKYRAGSLALQPDNTFDSTLSMLWVQWKELISSFRFKECLDVIWEFITQLNVYVDAEKPWSLAKAEKNTELNLVLSNLLEGLRHTSLLIYPFMPNTAQKIFQQIGLGDLPEKISTTEQAWGKFQKKITVYQDKPLFPKNEL